VSRLALFVAVLVAVSAVAIPSFAGGASRVRVSATPGGVRHVVSSAGGTFRATFATPVDRCLGLTVAAFGARGDHAALKLPQRACPPGD
jgi:hypothetical protein